MKNYFLKGNFLHINGLSSKFLITDLNWFSKIIELLMTNAEGVKSSNILIRDKKIRKIIGKNAPIWTKDQLKDRLADELQNKNDKVT